MACHPREPEVFAKNRAAACLPRCNAAECVHGATQLALGPVRVSALTVSSRRSLRSKVLMPVARCGYSYRHYEIGEPISGPTSEPAPFHRRSGSDRHRCSKAQELCPSADMAQLDLLAADIETKIVPGSFNIVICGSGP